MTPPTTWSTLLRASTVLAAPVVIIVFPTITMLARNPQHFPSVAGSGWVLFTIAALWAVIGTALYRRRGHPAGQVAFVAHALLAPAWLLYELARPTTGADLAAAGLGLFLVVAGAVMLARRPLDKALEHLGVAAVILIVGFGAVTGWEVAAHAEPSGQSDDSEDEAEPATPPDAPIPAAMLSDHPVVYHLVLDEFQTDAFELLLDEETRRALDGFTFYPEAIASWGKTHMSLSSMFSLRAYDYRQSPRRYVDQAYLSDRSTLRVLRESGYHITGFVPFVSLVGGDEPYDRVYEHTDLVDERSWSGSGASLALSMWAYRSLPAAIAERTIPDHHWEQLTGQGLLPDNAPAVSMEGFRHFLRAEATQPPHGRYVFVHLLHPHFPHVLDERCAYVPGRTTGPLRQSKCAIAAMSELIELLRELDRFEDAAIVIHGDHGGRYAVENGALRNIQPQGLYSEAFSRARSRALLLFKPPGVGSTGGALAVSERPATLDDIMPTLLSELDISASFGDDRTSLLAPAFPRRGVRHYHFYDSDTDEVAVGPITRYEVRGREVTREREIEPALPETSFTLQADGRALRGEDGTIVLVEDSSLTGVVEGMARARGQVFISGWSGDVEAGGLADFVVVTLDGESVYVGMEDSTRWDLVHRFERSGLRLAGFEIAFPLHLLDNRHPTELSVFAVRDGRAVELPQRLRDPRTPSTP